MVVYKFFLQIEGATEEYSYVLDLNPNQEDNPEIIFTQEIKVGLQKKLQKESQCAISEKSVEKIIQTWIEDIKKGYRESSIMLNIPLLNEANVNQIKDQGEQTIPNFLEPDLSTIEPTMGMLPPLESIFKL
ncbi:hypothetical protein [Gloeothece verrucosa]|uniref:Uncharacterized protein n=1 Tax=Gloeothece verrucosa (strain PCC 7822) TaxID=497965 RepID=E0UMI8_GLOV7|nr:hypothetical protein [Gloeothece verrucosa]ADN18168.1 conserved hypothetical protein [Gloeothece verrucosa PCC 7822]